jgi:hypothetical protein
MVRRWRLIGCFPTLITPPQPHTVIQRDVCLAAQLAQIAQCEVKERWKGCDVITHTSRPFQLNLTECPSLASASGLSANTRTGKQLRPQYGEPPTPPQGAPNTGRETMSHSRPGSSRAFHRRLPRRGFGLARTHDAPWWGGCTGWSCCPSSPGSARPAAGTPRATHLGGEAALGGHVVHHPQEAHVQLLVHRGRNPRVLALARHQRVARHAAAQPHRLPYGDQKVANRDIRVWHAATEKGP